MGEDDNQNVTVTVVSNLYNEESRLPHLLAMLEVQRPSDFRVVLIDDGSTDRTREIIDAYEGPLDLDLIALDHVGLAPARAVGLRAVTEGIAVVVDADMSFGPEWLAAVAAVFGTDHRAGGAFSRVASSGDAWLARGGQAVRDVTHWVRSRSRRPWMVGHGMAIRSEAFHALDVQIDDLTAEDLELSESLLASGWRVVPVDDPPIRTEDPPTVGEVWRRHLKVGRRTAHLVRNHPRFLIRVSSAGRFFPGLLLGAFVVDRRLALAGEIAFTGLLVWVMRQRSVPWRDVAPGWVVFHLQTTASLMGLLLEMPRALHGDRSELAASRGRETVPIRRPVLHRGTADEGCM